MSEKKWTRSALREISSRLAKAGHAISPPTVAQLLKEQDYSLKANVKKEAGKEHPDRDTQFHYIDQQRQAFKAQGTPIISIDVKKKELIGNFKNPGQAWCKKADPVDAHDFPQDALARAVPFGIYDTVQNKGSVYVGTSADTPQFAVDVLSCWWEQEGSLAYSHAKELLILADSGGSNSCRSRVFKQQIQEQLCDRFGLSVTLCHYPTGCSKWNPVEHRLFSFISMNWAGKPLRSLDTMLGYIRGTSTNTGLSVTASLVEGTYKRGQSVSDDEMEKIQIERHEICPTWNYTIRPHLRAVQNN